MLNRNDGEYPCLDFDFRGDNVNIMPATIKFTVGLFVGLLVLSMLFVRIKKFV